eukprot:TRINITY_DN2048_c0_g1_i4.p1 TRINITY_DN2048_c0_g1~~TRINITY_DN2048_c0_g1_i4.p1  ORF type:complete len:117 (+),score=18.77 TRINITY_DN2048_c0_g1_i4:409-759(+)
MSSSFFGSPATPFWKPSLPGVYRIGLSMSVVMPSNSETYIIASIKKGTSCGSGDVVGTAQVHQRAGLWATLSVDALASFSPGDTSNGILVCVRTGVLGVQNIVSPPSCSMVITRQQ